MYMTLSLPNSLFIRISSAISGSSQLGEGQRETIEWGSHVSKDLCVMLIGDVREAEAARRVKRDVMSGCGEEAGAP